MGDSDNKKGKSGLMRRIAANPWVVLAGAGVGVIGVILAVFLYLGSQEKRELVYTINPIRTTVVAAGKASELEILHRGKQVNDVDIIAAQVAIWNAGKQSIRQENILEEVTIITDPPVPILEASTRTRSREITEFTLLDTPQSRAEGRIPVSWHILEEDDGASVQLIYAGSEEVNFELQGIIEGREDIKKVELGVKIKTPVEQVRDAQRMRWLVISSVVVYGILMVMIPLYVFRTKRYIRIGAALFVVCVGFFSFMLWQLLSRGLSWPPFGF